MTVTPKAPTTNGTATAPEPVEYLPEPWLSYYLALRADAERATALRQQAQGLILEAVKTEAALQSWLVYASTHLGLEDVVFEPDGRITRTVP